ncbi:hypothetical protein IKE72_02030 [Candidatus Saccharibacteria bacterium]|nr:hypothetical protein [Candidatus Saccharibacteria bacterium]
MTKASSSSRPNTTSPSRRAEITRLVFLLLAAIILPLLFVAAVAGWFRGPGKVALDASDYCEHCGEEMQEISAAEYEQMVQDGKSFIVFVDQDGCVTADRLQGFVEDYAHEKGLKVYKIQFSAARDSSMHEKVKYYPSVVIVDKGRVHAYLRADSDEDAHAYNDAPTFRAWLEKYI